MAPVTDLIFISNGLIPAPGRRLRTGTFDGDLYETLTNDRAGFCFGSAEVVVELAQREVGCLALEVTLLLSKCPTNPGWRRAEIRG